VNDNIPPDGPYEDDAPEMVPNADPAFSVLRGAVLEPNDIIVIYSETHAPTPFQVQVSERLSAFIGFPVQVVILPR
jgi:hypothetical protein